MDAQIMLYALLYLSKIQVAFLLWSYHYHIWGVILKS